MQVIPRGLASRSGLRVGDRILEVNGTDLRHATHQEAVTALLSSAQELTVLVRRDPPPPGMQVRPAGAARQRRAAERDSDRLCHRGTPNVSFGWTSSKPDFILAGKM